MFVLQPQSDEMAAEAVSVDAEDRKKRALKWWNRRAWLGGRTKSDEALATRTSQMPSSVLRPSKFPLESRDAEESTPMFTAAVSHHGDNDDNESVTSTGSVSSILKRKKRSRQTHPEKSVGKSKSTNKGRKESSPGRAIRFADEEGKPVATIQVTNEQEELQCHNWVRFIVLMVAPEIKKFEFVHVYYHVREKNMIPDVLHHIREVATHRHLAKQRYVGLCRLSDGGSELLNSHSVQDYQLERHEVVAAIPKGMKASELVPLANHLIPLNKKVLRVMKRTPWEKKRIPPRPRSRLSQPLSMKELEDSLQPADEELALVNYRNSERLLPRIFHTGAFLMPLVAMRKTVASTATERAFFCKNA